MTTTKVKAAIISTSFANGGAEKFAVSLSFMFEKLNVEVHNIIINDVVDYQYTGKLLNLGKECKSSFILFKKLKKGILVYQYLKDNNIDIIVDNRSRNNFIRDLLFKYIFKNRKVWYIVHSFNLKLYFPKSVLLANLLYKNADKLICVSKAIENKVKQKFKFENTKTIYNSYDFSNIKLKENVFNTEKYILFFGRFDNKAKNFDLMLDAFSISKVFNKGYHLRLIGDGTDLDLIQDKIKNLQIDSFVEILPFMSNPFDYVQLAKFTILTSNYEGFPLSIIESLALGTPVIAVECNSGLKEIIKHESNGLLVEKNNSKSFADAMNRFVDDAVLYDFCKNNAQKSVEHLSLEAVSKQWESILF
ncbi:MAG: glycosyltransferase [Bacteroidota bacterium]